MEEHKEILKEAYGVFNVTPILEKYDHCTGKEVVIETPPDNEIKGRTGPP